MVLITINPRLCTDFSLMVPMLVSAGSSGEAARQRIADYIKSSYTENAIVALGGCDVWYLTELSDQIISSETRSIYSSFLV